MSFVRNVSFLSAVLFSFCLLFGDNLKAEDIKTLSVMDIRKEVAAAVASLNLTLNDSEKEMIICKLEQIEKTLKKHIQEAQDKSGEKEEKLALTWPQAFEYAVSFAGTIIIVVLICKILEDFEVFGYLHDRMRALRKNAEIRDSKNEAKEILRF